jgi:acyl transferase domain-containing protein/NADP-dependent 3-hydroxy acid dehydrogenase YdfG
MFPGRGDTLGYWRDIIEGADCISDVPPTHWLVEDYYDPDPKAPDKTYGKRGGFLAPQAFNPLEFGVPPAQLSATDTAQLLALIVAKDVLAQASASSLRSSAYKGVDLERTSVVLGVASATELVAHMSNRLQRPTWVKAMREAGLPEPQVQSIADAIADNYTPWQEASFPGLLGNVVAGRVANRLDLGGANYVTDAACASSLSAVHVGLHELWTGEADTVLAGGVDALNDILMYMCFSKTPALSPTGDCRPFSNSADGTILGEGVGVVALRRLEDAERDGNRVYAILKGLGAGSDGRATAIYAPLADGQARTLKRAYEAAGYPPNTVELVEAHGTGTKAGDAAEFKALAAVFGENGAEPGAPETGWCALGSVKSQIGHTKAAAGAASLIKAALALHHGVLPPTAKVERPNPTLGVEQSPFHINTAARPWIRGSNHPRRAAVSSFGFGGSNFHLTLEEYSGLARAPRLRVLPAELVLFSADTEDGLIGALDAVPIETDADLSRLADESHRSFNPASARRLAVVARSAADFRAKVEEARERIGGAKSDLPWPADLAYGAGAPANGKVAFLFPGQGSQYVGMGADLAMAFPAARAAWDAAADHRELRDAPLHRLAFPAPKFADEDRAADEARLKRMENAQPALAASSLAALAALERIGLKPDMTGGHSFGEIIALHAAGAFDADGALSIARRRGLAMAMAASTQPGAMLAVATDRASIDAIMSELGLDVVVANDNAPDQVVLSGSETAIADAAAALEARGLLARRLPVASAFHSKIVAGAVAPFRADLDRVDFAPPALPVYSNTTAAPYDSDVVVAKALLSEQLSKPVRFREQLLAMHAAGARIFIEVGAGNVLTGLVHKCLDDPSAVVAAIDHRRDNGVVALWRGLGALAAAGVAFDLSALLADQPAPPAAPPRAKHAVDITGANYAKPYPPQNGAAGLPKPNPEESNPRAPEKIQTQGAETQKAMTETNHHRPSSQNETSGPKARPPETPLQEARRSPAPPAGAASAIAAAHETYLLSTARAHEAFLAAMSGRDPQAAAETPPARPAPEPVVGAADSAPRDSTPSAEPRSAPEPAPPPVEQPAPAPQHPLTEHEPAPAPPASTPAPVAAPAAAGPDTAALIRAIVAEKTGYPEEMLGDDMDLEAELGVDSIKQVEILATLRERAPDLPEVDPGQLAELRSIGQIAAFVGKVTAASDLAPAAPASEPPASADPAPEPPAPTAPAAPAAAPSADAAGMIRAIVAEKTGYPEEMLGDDMDLEAELGVDSIKQVEILATLRERAPDLPEVDPGQLAELRSIGQIAAFLASAGGTEVAQEPRPFLEKAAAAPALNEIAVRALCIQNRPASGVALDGLLDATRIEVTDDAGDFAVALAAALRRAGRPAEVVASPSGEGDVVIVTSGADADAKPQDAAWRAIEHVQAAAPRFARPGGALVTIQDTGGAFGALSGARSSAWRGGLAGLAKTAAREWPSLAVKALDVAVQDGVEAAADSTVHELLAGGPETEVGLSRAHGRVAPALTTQNASSNDDGALSENMVIVATGGARGVTAAALCALAERTPLRLALLGRTEPLPPSYYADLDPTLDELGLRRALALQAQADGRQTAPAEIAGLARRIAASREIDETVRALEAAGSEAFYISVDVADEAAVVAALDQVRAKWGPIDGLVHGAGALADKRILDKTRDQFDRVFAPKALGLRALLRATAEDPLRLIALFSSVAGRFGNAGQCDYAMANETIARVGWAEARRRHDCLVRVFDWGPWAGGMVDPALKQHFEDAGVPLIGLEEGAAIFADAVSARAGSGSVECVVGAAATPPDRRRATAEAVIGADHPLLADHRIEGVTVLPAMMALDWFAGLAEAAWPDAGPLAIEDFAVLAGVSLDPGPNAEVRLRLAAETDPEDSGCLALRLTTADGRTRYAAVARPADPAAAKRAPRTPSGGAWNLTLHDAYAGPLFHGRALQALRALLARNDSGAAVEIASSHTSGAASGLDVTVLDAGLQAALLWGLEPLGGGSLPVGVQRFTTFDRAGSADPVRAELASWRLDSRRALHDIGFYAADGSLLALMEGVEMIAAPALSDRDGPDRSMG